MKTLRSYLKKKDMMKPLGFINDDVKDMERRD